MRRRDALLGAGMLLTGAGRAAAQAGGELRLGAVFPFTGPRALLGDESFRGFELAVEERTEAGGLVGQRLRIIKADAVDPAQATAAARQLIGPEHAQLVFGAYASSLSLAVTQVTDAAAIPYVELAATADAITGRGLRLVFRTSPSARQVAEVSADAVAAVAEGLGVPARSLRLAIVSEDGTEAAAGAAALKARLAEVGLTPVEEIAHGVRVADLSHAVERLRAAEADIVLHRAQENEVVLLYRAMREAGWTPKAVIGSGDGYCLAETARAVGPLFGNTLAVAIAPLAASERSTPGGRGFAEAYARRYGHPPRSGHSVAAFSGTRIVFDALARAGSADREKLRAALLATEIAPFGTPAGWGARFDETGQNTLARPFLMQWQGEQLRTISPPEAAQATLRIGLGTG